MLRLQIDKFQKLPEPSHCIKSNPSSQEAAHFVDCKEEAAPISLLFPNPPLQSLQTTHRALTITAPLACKFPAEVAPFAGVLENSAAAFHDLLALMEPGESTYVLLDANPATDQLAWKGPFPIQQLAWPADSPIPATAIATDIEPLTCNDASAMVTLTGLAFPGFFRPRTCMMGQYFGIRAASTGNGIGDLIAMCGERLNIETPTGIYRELSGLCTHPAHRGHGYAQALMAHLLQIHRDTGVRSYLHVAASNTQAAAIYLRMGFILRGQFDFYRMSRPMIA